MTPDKGFTQVPKEFTKDTRLSPAARLTGEIILGFQFQDGVTYVTQDKIAERLGQSPRQTRKHLNQLENLGWVVVERRRKADGTWHSNRYSFCTDPIHRNSSSDGVPMDPAIGTTVPVDAAIGTAVFARQNQRNPSEAIGTVVPHTNNISTKKDASDGEAVAALVATPASEASELRPSQPPSPSVGLYEETPSHRNSGSYGEAEDCELCRDPSYFHPDKCPPTDEQLEAYNAWVEVGKPPVDRAGQPLFCRICGERKEFQKSDNPVMHSSWYCHNWKDERHRGKRPREY